MVILHGVCWTFELELAARTIATGQTEYLKRTRLRSRLREALTVLGDRLETPGRELVTVTGTLTWAPQGKSVTFEAVWEFPGRLHLETPQEVLDFDGQTLTGAATPSDQVLVETFFYQTAEHFFLGQAHGLPTRFLGSRFRLDDGQGKNYSGPYYDIYQVIDPVSLDGQLRMEPKLYYLNSDTLLLERVRYQSNRDSTRKDAEVQLDRWQRINNQSIPGRIVLTENGQVLFTVTIDSAVIGPLAQ